MTRSAPNHVSVRHIPAIIEAITPLIREVEGGCMWANPSHSDSKVAEIVGEKIGITITKGNMRRIRDECFGPMVKRGNVDEVAELRERVQELENQFAMLMRAIDKSPYEIALEPLRLWGSKPTPDFNEPSHVFVSNRDGRN